MIRHLDVDANVLSVIGYEESDESDELGLLQRLLYELVCGVRGQAISVDESVRPTDSRC